MTTIYAGAQAPESLAVTITSGPSNFDLMTVKEVNLVVRDVQNPAGSPPSWKAIISGQTSAQLTATYTFGGNDVPNAAVYRIMPHLVLNDDGVRRCAPFNLQVLE